MKLIFPFISKPWFQGLTAVIFLTDFLVGFDLFHSVGGFILYMGTMVTSTLLVLETLLQTIGEITYRLSRRQVTKA